jgi:hypothetical protein
MSTHPLLKPRLGSASTFTACSFLLVFGCKSKPPEPSIDQVLKEDLPSATPLISGLEKIVARLDNDPQKQLKVEGIKMSVSGGVNHSAGQTPNTAIVYEDDLKFAPAKKRYFDRITIFSEGKGDVAVCWYAAKKQEWAPRRFAADADPLDPQPKNRKMKGSELRSALSNCNISTYLLVVSPKSFQGISGLDQSTKTFSSGGSAHGVVRAYELSSGSHLGDFDYFATLTVALGSDTELADEIERQIAAKIKATPNAQII